MKAQVIQPSDLTTEMMVGSPTKPAPGKVFSTADGGPVLSDEALAAGRAARAKSHSRFAGSENGVDDPIEAEAETDPTPREYVDSVEIELPNRKVVLYGPKHGAAKALVLGRIMGTQVANLLGARAVETLMNVRAINGVEVKPLASLVDAQRLLDEVGDDGLEHLSVAHNTFWPPATAETLRVLKKNLR